MFVNRKNELQILEQAWRERKSNFIIIYGRRRVGKTELIKQFLKNKNGFYFLADRLPEKENLKTLTRILGEYYSDAFLADFDNWILFFKYLKLHIHKKTVIAIDEFPYLVETNPALSSVFQKGWDEYLKGLPVFLILCGSSIGMMERETLIHKAPLYGRRTGQILIKPLSFHECVDFFPNASFDKRLGLYTISGGVPAYIQQLDPKLSVENNVVRNILKPGKFLYEEVNFLLKEEVREPRIYFAILKAIALGKRKFSEIVNSIGIEKTSLHKYLYTLEGLGIVEKEFPVTEKNILKSRKGFYKIKDHFIRFWFNFVFPYHSELEIGNTKPSLSRLEQSFVHLAAITYEEIACDILRKYKEYLFDFFRIGRWWEKNNEIDVVAFDEYNENVLFAEVKWSTRLVGIDVYRSLLEKSKLIVSSYRRAHYAILSRSGFTEKMISTAKREKILLIRGDKLQVG